VRIAKQFVAFVEVKRITTKLGVVPTQLKTG
jgi:hypothetical protein